MHSERNGYYSNINLKTRHCRMDLATSQDVSYKLQVRIRLAFTRRACVLTQRLMMCQNYFRCHFSRYIYDKLYDKRRDTHASRATGRIIARRNHKIWERIPHVNTNNEINYLLRRGCKTISAEIYIGIHLSDEIKGVVSGLILKLIWNNFFLQK